MVEDVLLQILADQRVGRIPPHYVLEHRRRYVHRDAAQLANARIDGPLRQVHFAHALCQRKGGGGENVRRDLADLADDGRQPHPREDEDVVALADPELLPLVVHILERAAGGDDGLALAPAIDVLRQRLAVGGRVGEREHHGARAVVEHQLDMLLLEGATRTAGAQQYRDGHVAQHVGQVGLAGHFGIPARQQQARLGIAALVFVQPLTVVAHQPLGIQNVDAIAGRLGIQPFADHARTDLIRHPDPAGTGAIDQVVLLAQGLALDLDRPYDARQHHGPGPLDIVVERRQRLLITGEVVEGVGLAEVLPLQHGIGEVALDPGHELVDEVVVLLAANALVGLAQIHGVIQQRLVVGAHVQRDGQAAGGVDAGTQGIEGELADGDAHAAHPLITNPQDPLAVGHDNDAHRLGIEMTGQGAHVLDVLRGDVEAARLLEAVAELLTRLAHGRGIDVGGHLLHVACQQGVEQSLVAILQGPQVLVLLDVAAGAQKALINPLKLGFKRLNLGRQQAVELEVGALLFGEGGTLVEVAIVEQIGASQCNGAKILSLCIFPQQILSGSHSHSL